MPSLSPRGLMDEMRNVIFFALSQRVAVKIFPAYTCLVKSWILEVHIIVIVDVVKSDDLLSIFKKVFEKMNAGETVVKAIRNLYIFYCLESNKLSYGWLTHISRLTSHVSYLISHVFFFPFPFSV